MTFKQFKTEFEACENGQAFTSEFASVLTEIQNSFGAVNFKTNNSYLLKGLRPESCAFGFSIYGSALVIIEKVFLSMLSDISNDDKCDIISYCFSKYFSIDMNEILHVFPCDKSMIECLVRSNKSDFERTDIYYDESTGEIFSENQLNILIDKTNDYSERKLILMD